MASTSNYVFPAEGLDYLLGVVPKGGTTPATLYLGLFTTSWATIQGYGLTNTSITLNGGTYPVTELSTSTGYATRPSLAAATWGAATAGTTTIGANTINVRQSTYGSAITITNGSAGTWTGVNGMFIATSATVGQASGSGTTVLWYAPFSDASTVTLAPGDSVSITPTWQSAPYPA